MARTRIASEDRSYSGRVAIQGSLRDQPASARENHRLRAVASRCGLLQSAPCRDEAVPCTPSVVASDQRSGSRPERMVLSRLVQCMTGDRCRPPRHEVPDDREPARRVPSGIRTQSSERPSRSRPESRRSRSTAREPQLMDCARCGFVVLGYRRAVIGSVAREASQQPPRRRPRARGADRLMISRRHVADHAPLHTFRPMAGRMTSRSRRCWAGSDERYRPSPR